MYIAIEGVIGVGKTTLARLLAQAFEADLLLEIFEENPFLSDFYADRDRYAFQTQIFFLLSRYHQQRRGVSAVIDEGRSLISDYTFAKDALFAHINLKGDELEMYHKVHQALAEKIVMPDLLVYLPTRMCSCSASPCGTVPTSATWTKSTLKSSTRHTTIFSHALMTAHTC